MKLDPFSLDVIEYSCVRTEYAINTAKHTESLVYYVKGDNNVDFPLNLISDVPQDSIWLSLLDYDMPDSPQTLEAFALIEKAFSLLSFLCEDKSLKRGTIITIRYLAFDAHILAKRNELSLEILDLLRQAMELKPAIGYFYAYFHGMLNQLFDAELCMKESGITGTGHIPDITYGLLAHEINSFRDTYSQARDAIYNIFMRPEELRILTLPEDILDLYRIYSLEKGDSFFKPYEKPSADKQSDSLADSWDSFLMESLAMDTAEIIGPSMLTLKGMAQQGIESLKNANTVIRKCDLCGGYFKARYNSKQTCCSRLYRDTKMTCYEYASRKSYKDKLKEHPVYQEYIKAYNRLYGRIRRKTLPADTPLANQLKDLREEFYAKYDSAPPEMQAAVLEEYIWKNEELLE